MRTRLPQLSRWRFRGFTLTRQFLLVAVIPIGLNFLVLGYWVSGHVTELVVHQQATTTALYVDSFIEPLVQDLSQAKELSQQRIAEFDQLFASRAITSSIARVKIWNLQGTVVYSNMGDLRGQSFPLTKSLLGAMDGQVLAEYDDTSDDENVSERDIPNKLLEIYVPVRETRTGRVIAVAEIYAIADTLGQELRSVMIRTWAIAGALSLLTLAALWGIVARGSRTIQLQRVTMQSQIEELGRLLSRVQELQRSVDEGHKRAAESTERLLRRVGSDLHDGPAQGIGLVVLQLGELEQFIERSSDAGLRLVVERMDDLLTEALDDIRGIAAGLAPPELSRIGLSDSLQLAAKNHQWRSGTEVAVDVDPKLPDVPLIVRTCLYRFVQEGLNNAFRHAGGAGQLLRATVHGRRLTVEVSDAGPGIGPDTDGGSRPRLGLTNMQDRVKSLGGEFEILSHSGQGTIVRAVFDLAAGNNDRWKPYA